MARLKAHQKPIAYKAEEPMEKGAIGKLGAALTAGALMTGAAIPANVKAVKEKIAAKLPANQAKAPTTQSGEVKPVAQKAEEMEKGWKGAVAGAALALAPAAAHAKPQFIPHSYHTNSTPSSAQREGQDSEGRQKLSINRPSPAPKAPVAIATRKADVWAGEGVPAQHEQAPKGQYSMEQHKAAKVALGRMSPPGNAPKANIALQGVPKASSPVMNARRPAKPGLFGSIFGKSEDFGTCLWCKKPEHNGSCN
jgi:hypothetical protein